MAKRGHRTTLRSWCEALYDLPATPPVKDTDLFFSGAYEHSTVRERGRRQIELLRERGVRVNVAEGGLAQIARMAADGRALVQQHFTHRALCTYVAQSCGVL